MKGKDLIGRAGGALGRAGGAVTEAGGAAKDRATQAGGAAKDRATRAGDAAKDRASDALKGLSERVPGMLVEIGSPGVPLEAPWGIGFGRFLADTAGIPEKARGVTKLLDRFGQLEISREHLSIDGNKVAWSDMTGITFGSPTDAFTTGAVDQAVQRLTSSLPKFPGRKALIKLAIQVLATVCLAVKATIADFDTSGGEPIPMTIQYGGKLRRKEVRLGLFASLLSVSKPDVASAINDLAAQHAVTVTVNKPSRAIAAAAAIGAIAGRLTKRAEEPVPEAPPELEALPDADVADD
ncbi:MAG: hypothetical protein ABIQ01_06525 [Pseudolysinimonas sp.]